MTDYAMTMPAPGGAEKFTRTAIDVPAPGPGEALVRHTAIALNYLDVYHRSGSYPWPVEKDAIVGSEAAGVVEAVGEGVRDVAVGDRVAYTKPWGAYCTRRTIAADRLVKLPDAIPDEVAATLMVKGLTAHYLIHDTFRVAPGMKVLVHAAAGGVGLVIGQWLAHLGVTAIGTAGGPEKGALAREHGYAHVIDYRAGDWPARVKEIAPEGLPVVYDSVGRDTWTGSLACLAKRGTFVCFGQSSGPIEGFTLGHLGSGGSLYATRPTLFDYIASRADLVARADALFSLVATGTISGTVHQRLALTDAEQAHRALESRATTGASVLIP